MPNQEAQGVAWALVEIWITGFGCLINIHSDKWTNNTSQIFSNICWILGIGKISTKSLHPETKAMIKSTSRTWEECFSKYVDDNQQEWNSYPQLVMMAYHSSVHAVTKYNPSYVVPGTLLRLPIVCMYETRQTKLFPKPSDSLFNTKRETQRAHHLVRAEIEAEQTCHKMFNDYLV